MIKHYWKHCLPKVHAWKGLFCNCCQFTKRPLSCNLCLSLSGQLRACCSWDCRWESISCIRTSSIAIWWINSPPRPGDKIFCCFLFTPTQTFKAILFCCACLGCNVDAIFLQGTYDRHRPDDGSARKSSRRSTSEPRDRDRGRRHRHS